MQVCCLAVHAAGPGPVGPVDQKNAVAGGRRARARIAGPVGDGGRRERVGGVEPRGLGEELGDKLLAAALFLLTLSERIAFDRLLFKALSALGTVGLSLGATGELTEAEILDLA